MKKLVNMYRRQKSELKNLALMIMGILLILTLIFTTNIMSKNNSKNNRLTTAEEAVIVNKGTEQPFSGIYNDHKEKGTYVCKRCDAPLYKSEDKFDSHCGWPSFDDEISNAIKHLPDADGSRTEILCNNCGGHLGHIFIGEGLTDKNTRHCVNSISMNFISATNDKLEKAYFAGGCFWGVEHYFLEAEGVVSTDVGFMGGKTDNPTYSEICYENTGHAEVLEVVFDPEVTSFEKMAKLFFEIHDPSQINRQGPDVGDQYRSAVFYINDNQKEITEKLVNILREKKYDVATEITMAGSFWIAEENHQEYYKKKNGLPYCHSYQKKF